MPKISSYADGGAIQTTDKFVVARSGSNVSILGSALPRAARKKTVVTVVAAATPAINTDNGDVFVITGQNANITSLTTNLTGSPNNKDMFLLEITDNGTPRTIAPGAKFAGTANNSLTGLTTTANKKLMLLWQWDTGLNVWELVGKDSSL